MSSVVPFPRQAGFLLLLRRWEDVTSKMEAVFVLLLEEEAPREQFAVSGLLVFFPYDLGTLTILGATAPLTVPDHAVPIPSHHLPLEVFPPPIRILLVHQVAVPVLRQMIAPELPARGSCWRSCLSNPRVSPPANLSLFRL